MIEPLKNCPNCGGTLEDSGRCRFCGSKIYDFVNVDFDHRTPTYIRIRNNGKIITAPVVFKSGSMRIDYPTTMIAANNDWRDFVDTPSMTGSIDYTIVGEVIYEVFSDDE